MRSIPSRLRRLDAALADLPLDEPMLLTELDGFLTALLVVPGDVPEVQWMEAVWGTDGDGPPPFDDPIDVRWFRDAVVAHRDEIARALARGRARPIFDVDGRSGDVLWEAWLDGFADALALQAGAWEVLAEDDRPAVRDAFARLSTLLAVAAGDSELDSVAINALDDAAPDDIAASIVALHAARSPATVPVAVPADVGRNDPCPCGSGAKFKRCCG